VQEKRLTPPEAPSIPFRVICDLICVFCVDLDCFPACSRTAAAKFHPEICFVAGSSIRSQSLVGSIEKQEFQRRCRKAMHAEHADSSEMNALSGHMIGCTTKGAKAHDKKASWSGSISLGKPRLAIKRVAHVLRTAPHHPRVLRASPSCICVKILPWPATPRAR
jgi:hypothetical protein